MLAHGDPPVGGRLAELIGHVDGKPDENGLAFTAPLRASPVSLPFCSRRHAADLVSGSDP